MILKDLSLYRETFQAETSRPQRRELRVALSGCADLRVQSEFGALVHSIHQEAWNMNVATVYVNMEKLEFLNSGCFKSLCTWVRLLLTRQATYKIRILSNPRYHWQARSLSAMHMLAPDLVSIETIESK